jgi:anti-sigma factor ChrR (cupin superfamily)
MTSPRSSSPVITALGLQVHLDAAADEGEWLDTRYEGVQWRPLVADKSPEGGVSALIRMQPGTGYPAHKHLDFEDVLILAGGYRDEFGEHCTGTYLRYPPGSTHAPVALGDSARESGPENPACLLFAVARGGIELEGDTSSTGE